MGVQLDMFDQERAVTAEPFCQGCEFVKLLHPDGLGYCQVHGDIDSRENNPRNHVGENL